MAESKHTPGPWRAGVDGALGPGLGLYLYSLHVYAGTTTDETDEVEIAWCSCREDDSQDDATSPKLGPARANAILIAAAPDLLAALKTAADKLERCIVLSGIDPEFAAIAVSDMREAIAKAEPA